MTAPTTTPGPLNGQDISVTANATRTVFDRLLAEAGTEFESWVALRQLAQAGGTLPRPDLTGRLTTLLKLDNEAASLLLQRLLARGWVTSGADVALSQGGASFYERLVGQVTELTADLYRDLDPADLATTKHILSELARRATAHIGQ